jgi:release factor glutamine methyltransferase
MTAVSMRPSDVLRRGAAFLAAHDVDSPEANAEALLMLILATDRVGLYTRTEGLSTAEARLFGRALCQRCTGTPLQHLTGEQPFMDLVLEVRPGVFVPRPETEVLVEAALDLVREVASPVVVDVGTGTGAVALAIKQARPEARVAATDVSEAAVSLASENAGRLGLDVEVLLGDLLDPVPAELRGSLDLLVSNPPYVTEAEYEALPPEVRADPYEALVGGTDVHGRLVGLASEWLRPGGWLVVEIGADQGSDVAALFEERLDDVAVVPDLAGRDRVVRGRLLKSLDMRSRPTSA